MKPVSTARIKALGAVTLCLTGASGYVGTHLVAALGAAGIRPFVIGRPGPRPPAQSSAVHHADPWHTSADLAAQLAALENPVVINLAGHFVSAHAPDDIPALVAGNLTFPITIFDALAALQSAPIVNVGTSWEYSDAGAPAPANLYASLKSANARTLNWYAGAKGLRGVNLKLNDTFGGDDPRAKLMPLLRKHSQSGAPCALRAAAQPINLLYIDDVVDGLLAAAAHAAALPAGTVEEAFLLGPETCTMQSLVDRIRSGPAPALAVSFASSDPDQAGLRGVWDAAPRLAHWSPATPLDEGLGHYFAKESPDAD